MSYREKSIWISFGLTIYLIYFYNSGLSKLQVSDSLTESAFAGLLATTALYLVVISIVAHTVAAIINYKEADTPADERDKLIELYGCRIGYYCLSFGVIASVVQSQLDRVTSVDFQYGLLAGSFGFMHIIIMSFLIAETVKYAAQLFYYRRGF